MMKLYRYLLIFFAYGAVFASEKPELLPDEEGWEEMIPFDPKVILGQLENGLTYYIRENRFPKDRASLRLVVKAGSLHEEEHERGLAHFLEHMLFRGTKHFQDWEIINFLESIGAQFGADTNAMTSFDSTTYMLEIPLDKSGVLEKSIFILSDWAARANLEDAMINKERSVILDEYNISKKNVGGKLLEKLIGHFLANSKYPARFPIGKREVILESDPEVIREFYRKWYTPDRMAVIAVGDFDSQVVESAIREFFGEIECKKEEMVEPDLLAHFPEKQTYFFADFPELMGNEGGFCRFFNILHHDFLTKVRLKQSIILTLYHNILNQRLIKSSKTNPPPYLHAQASQMQISNYIGCDSLSFVFFEDRLIEGLKTFYDVIQILNTFGPSAEEFNRAVEELRHEFEQRLENLDRVKHSTYAGKYIDHFLNESDYSDLQTLYEAKKEVLKTIKSQDLINDDFLDVSNFHPFFITVKQIRALQNEIEDQLFLLENFPVTKPVEESKQDLVILSSDRGDIVSTEVNDNYQTIEFSNGLKLIIHPTKLEKSDIQVFAVAKGGANLFPIELSSSLSFADLYLLETGFGNMDGQRIRETLDTLGISLDLALEQNLRCISLNGKSTDAELIFQMIKAIFLEKRFDPNIWNSIILKYRELEKNQINNSYKYFNKKIKQTLTSHHSSESHPKEEEAKEIISKAFNDPGDFTLVVVGDVDPGQISELALTHLSFQPKEKSEWKCYTRPQGSFPTETVDLVIEKGEESHCVNVMMYEGSFSLNDKRKTFSSLDALSFILNNRLIEKIRREWGDSYVVSCSKSLPFAAENDYSKIIEFKSDERLIIVFTCEEEKSGKLKKCVEDEVQRLLAEGPKEEEVITAREILFQKKKKALQSNQEWLRLHLFNALNDGSFQELVDYPTYLEQEVTRETLHALAKELFENKPIVKATLISEK